MNIHTVYSFFNRGFRRRRIKQLRNLLPQIDNEDYSILDIGGTFGWWELVNPGSRAITIGNMDRREALKKQSDHMHFVEIDGRALPFQGQQFDLAFSNSVIEHVGTLDDQRLFANEMRRVGRSIYMQTPNRLFPIEPHLIAPIVHWLPKRIQRRIIRWVTIWGWIARPTQAQIDEFLRTTRLLTIHEIRMLFPECVVLHERWLWMTKSFVVITRDIRIET